MSKLQALVKQVEVCQLCPLCRGRHRAVPGEGNENATVLLIGEGPGYHEDREGRPFIGPAGQFLDELLELAGLRRADVYITNVVKCRPPNNRDPLPLEIESCAPYLERQIAMINPRVIVTLGRYSMAKFVNETSISRIHGQAWQYSGRLVVTMYHPAAGLHNQQLKDVIREDFRKLPGFIEQAVRLEPLAPPAPPAVPEDPRAVLDAYALLVAASAPPPEPPVEAMTIAEPEPVFVAAAPEPAVPTNGELADAAGPLEITAETVALAGANDETSMAATGHVDLPTSPEAPAVSDVVAPPVARRGPRRKAAAPAPIAVEAAPEPETSPLLMDTRLAEPEGIAPATNGHTAVLDVAPSLPPPDLEPAPEERSAAAGRKKGKPAVEAEQLSMF